MNTPPTKKRFQVPDRADFESGGFDGQLRDPDYKLALADIVTEFEHLEYLMPWVLGVLLGLPVSGLPGYVYRAIRNASTRADLMRQLLEKAPENSDVPEFFDEILREYGRIRQARNEYVHGLWSTKQEDGRVFLARFPEHDWYMPGESKHEPLEALQKVLAQIGALKLRLVREVHPYAFARHGQRQELARQIFQRQAEKAQEVAQAKPERPPES